MTVPDGVQGTTAEWLSTALGRAVAGVMADPIGTGQTGCSYCLDVPWAEDGRATFVAKTGAEDPDVRERVAFGYRAEVAFYRDIALTVEIPVPRVPAVVPTEDCSQFVLLVDGLAPAGQGYQLAGADRDVVQAFKARHP